MKRHSFPLAVTAAVAAVALSGCGDDEPADKADDPGSTPASESASATEQSDPTTTPASEETSEPGTPSDTGSAETVPTAIFFVADTPQGPRLFAEQRDVEADNPSAESLALLMAGDVADADYRTLVPAGSLALDPAFDGTGDDGTYTLSVTSEAWTERPQGMSRADAELAVQQLVYTLLTQAGDGEKTGMTGSVVFLLDNEETSYLGVTDVAKAADELDVRALVNVLAPAEGAIVSGTFEASGEASSFEATVPWQVRDASDEVVVEGFSTAEGWIDGLYPWRAEVDLSGLEPGTYTFAAMTDDPSGGEGAGPTEDTKTIVVE